MNKKLIIFFIILLTQESFASGTLKDSLKISASALKAQQERMRIIAENIANKDVTSPYPGGEPYRRKLIVLKNKKDRKNGINKVVIEKYINDTSTAFKLIYNPGHPAADEKGYVLYPNINLNIENIDNKDAVRSFEANLSMIELTKMLHSKTMETLK